MDRRMSTGGRGGGGGGGGGGYSGGRGGGGRGGRGGYAGGGGGGGGGAGTGFQRDVYDGKRRREGVKVRESIDYYSSIARYMEERIAIRDHRDVPWLQPHLSAFPAMLPPHVRPDEPAQCVTTRFFHHSVNKVKCPIFSLKWTPEGRRLISGASTGEFTLWNGLTFNFETILQAHQSGVRDMVWSHNHNWMVTCDDDGKIMYWQSNMNQVTQFEAHKDRICRLCFSPTDTKLATASEDGTVKFFDFEKCREERVGRGGHGAEVRSIAWHPTKGLVASGGRDATRALVLWDPRTANALSTLALHRNTVSDIRFNDNGNWMITSSWDHLIKVFDIRAMKEIHHFRGHKNDVQCLALHPHHETVFASGGRDGSIFFWEVGNEQPIGSIEKAHDSLISRLDWHPVGHLLASGSNDRFVKFWTRNFPGDTMRDRYNLALDEPAEYTPRGQYMRPATLSDAAPPPKTHGDGAPLPAVSGDLERAQSRARGEGLVPGLSSGPLGAIPGLGGVPVTAAARGLDAGPAIPGLGSAIPGFAPPTGYQPPSVRLESTHRQPLPGPSVVPTHRHDVIEQESSQGGWQSRAPPQQDRIQQESGATDGWPHRPAAAPPHHKGPPSSGYPNQQRAPQFPPRAPRGNGPTDRGFRGQHDEQHGHLAGRDPLGSGYRGVSHGGPYGGGGFSGPPGNGGLPNRGGGPRGGEFSDRPRGNAAPPSRYAGGYAGQHAGDPVGYGGQPGGPSGRMYHPRDGAQDDLPNFNQPSGPPHPPLQFGGR